ncbi:MaoC family dehydratase [uncultured Erythrobacter sp.]|uniref:MaoC family dehydratase n=1 Tax=uncultured Erythrobacter sp. TaxID=263913 RepID=UPI002608FE0C|nr:MaoC family dehydratase [uncultured Erythrobacter sp.]
MTEWSEIQSKVGTEIGVSDWILVDQAMIDQFADVTKDRQYIHVDQDAARETPFGGTIAHGFLTLSLLTHMIEDVALFPPKMVAAINQGMDRVRFLSPVHSGEEVRGCFVLDDIEDKRSGRWKFVYRVRVEIKGTARPALTARWLSLVVTEPEGSTSFGAAR